MEKPNLIQILLVGTLVAGLPLLGTSAWADDSAQLKKQVQALQNRVDQLESELANRQQVAATSSPMPVYDQWEDPFTQMMMLQQQMDRNMRGAFANTSVFSPKMDIKQTDKHYIITMDIPGMDKDKINVQTNQGMLIISGERQSEESQDNKSNQFYRQERTFGSFTQSIPLPEDARTDQIDASYKNGVLKVTVVREKKEPKSASTRITVN